MKIKDFVDAELSYDPKQYSNHSDKDLFDSVNPNIPTDEHQNPIGANITVTWNKNSDSKGSSILHLPKQVLTLVQVYLSKRLKRFALEEKFKTGELDLKVPLFVTGQGTPFRQVKLDKHVKTDACDGPSEKVNPGHYRHKLSTWAQIHPDSEVRECEADALQHDPQIAKNYYLLNKKSKPQKLVQTFVTETNSFPSNIQAAIDSAEDRAQEMLTTQAKDGKQARMEQLLKKKNEKVLLRLSNEDYGVKRRILNEDCKKFKVLMEKCHQVDVFEKMEKMSPREWRHFVVRTVCTARDDDGKELRELWKKIYAGDLKWGVRDARLEAKTKQWPRRAVTSLKDRNSWNSAILRKYVTIFLKKMKQLQI